MNLYPCNDRDLEDPFLASYTDITYRERYAPIEDENNEEPWAVYDPN